MTQHVESATLIDLVEVLNDGNFFYEEAARHVHADLAAFRKAVEEAGDPGVREVAQHHLPQVTRDHNDMRAMKRIKQAHG